LVSFTFAMAYILIRLLSTSLSRYSLAGTVIRNVSPETKVTDQMSFVVCSSYSGRCLSFVAYLTTLFQQLRLS
jgi:hypothetical protein